MPQYVNPDNPNAGELIATKVDPVSGMVVEVNPHTDPSFKPVQDDPDRPSQGKEAEEMTEAEFEAAKVRLATKKDVIRVGETFIENKPRKRGARNG
jgi:hypothetical protein